MVELKEWKPSPGHLVTLVEIHAEPNGPCNAHSARDLRDAGLAANYRTGPSGWELTGRGLAWLQMLLSTPLPVQVSRWEDPRTVLTAGEPVGCITSAASEWIAVEEA